MSRLVKLFLYGLAITGLLVSCAQPSIGQPQPTAQMPVPIAAEESAEPGLPLLACVYFDRELFLSAVTSPPMYETGGYISAGLIPHHLLASDMIAGFFSAAAWYGEYDRVIVVSTSHYPAECGSEVVTAAAGWDTPYGPLQGDAETIGLLLRNSVIAAEDNPLAMERDHGVSGLMPFIRYYLPDVKVTAILLANTLGSRRLEEVWRVLEPVCADDRTLLVLSVDFSHYLMPDDAAKRDEETARAIESFDYAQIARFGDENVDSPQAVTLLLWHTQGRGAELKQLDHSTSAYKLPQGISHPIYFEGITTYFVYVAIYNDTSQQ